MEETMGMEVAQAALQVWARRNLPPESQGSDEIIKEVEKLVLLMSTITNRIYVLNKELESRCT